MPIDPYIARGIAPVGADVPQIGNMLFQKQQAEARNALVAQQNARESDTLALQRDQFNAGQAKIQNEYMARSKLAEMESARATGPQGMAAYVAKQAQQHPEFAQTPFAQMPPDQAFEAMYRGLYTQINGKPPEGPQPRDVLAEQKFAWEQKKFEREQALEREKIAAAERARAAGNVPGAKPPTEAQATAGGYLLRMTEAEKLLGNQKPAFKDWAAFQSVLNNSNGVMASAANAAISDAGQQYFQAASDWVRAKLRKESGAVIGPQEMVQEIRTYFPMPGDSPKVIEQKRRARETAQKALGLGAGSTAAASQPAAAPASGDWSIEPVQ